MTPKISKNQHRPAKDYLWLNLRDLPYFRALLRAVEARFYEGIALASPTLDLGCGDGHFAAITFNQPLDFGVDPWWKHLWEAQSRGAYCALAQSDGARLPFQNDYFASAISNSVLEHIPHVESVLKETARVLKPKAVFVFCVPNDNFLPMLSIGQWFDHIGLGFIGNFYRSFFNGISRHFHCDPPEIWKTRLEEAGFQVESWWNYFSPEALHILEWGHFFGFPSWIWKRLVGRWILCPASWNLTLTNQLVKPYYDEPLASENGVYSFFIATRI